MLAAAYDSPLPRLEYQVQSVNKTSKVVRCASQELPFATFPIRKPECVFPHNGRQHLTHLQQRECLSNAGKGSAPEKGQIDAGISHEVGLIYPPLWNECVWMNKVSRILSGGFSFTLAGRAWSRTSVHRVQRRLNPYIPRGRTSHQSCRPSGGVLRSGPERIGRCSLRASWISPSMNLRLAKSL